MQSNRGVIGVEVLIAIFVGLLMLGGGTYVVMQSQTPLPATSENSPGIFPNAKDQNQQPTNNGPVVNDALTINPPPTQLKTYTNSKQGYSIQYPADWTVEKERIILDAVNKIPSVVTLISHDKKQNITILLNQKESQMKNESLNTQRITVAGAQQTAYLFPEGYECHMADPGREDCSFFLVPIYRNGMWYELKASGKAESITDFYQKILSTFTFLP